MRLGSGSRLKVVYDWLGSGGRLLLATPKLPDSGEELFRTIFDSAPKE
jgi:hypothetical protein